MHRALCLASLALLASLAAAGSPDPAAEASAAAASTETASPEPEPGAEYPAIFENAQIGFLWANLGHAFFAVVEHWARDEWYNRDMHSGRLNAPPYRVPTFVYDVITSLVGAFAGIAAFFVYRDGGWVHQTPTLAVWHVFAFLRAAWAWTFWHRRAFLTAVLFGAILVPFIIALIALCYIHGGVESLFLFCVCAFWWFYGVFETFMTYRHNRDYARRLAGDRIGGRMSDRMSDRMGGPVGEPPNPAVYDAGFSDGSSIGSEDRFDIEN